MLPIVERALTCVLGKNKRAEQLVDWSIERARPGSRWVKKFPCGLLLHFVAHGAEPKMYIHWNPAVFRRFLREQALCERFFLSTWGFAVQYQEGHTQLRLLGAGRTTVLLWDSRLPFCTEQETAESDVNFLTGMVRFAPAGPVFLSEVECQQELEEASALAVIRTTEAHQARFVPRETTPSPLPTHELSGKARAFLLRDAAVNMALQQARKAGGVGG